MKIAVSSTGTNLDADLDPRFGRCARFLLIDTENLDLEVVENPAATLGSGAGIQAAKLVAERGVRAVLTGDCGPNAHETLTAAGVQVVVGCSGRIGAAVEQFKAGALRPAAAPSVTGHHAR